jgi:hypothetical protein
MKGRALDGTTERTEVELNSEKGYVVTKGEDPRDEFLKRKHTACSRQLSTCNPILCMKGRALDGTTERTEVELNSEKKDKGKKEEKELDFHLQSNSFSSFFPLSFFSEFSSTSVLSVVPSNALPRTCCVFPF